VRGRHPDRLGFTLVELLVVIAIIGVLGGAPAAGGAGGPRVGAAVAVQQTNLRQVGLAVHNYESSFRATFRRPVRGPIFFSTTPPSTTFDRQSFFTVILAYFGAGKCV